MRSKQISQHDVIEQLTHRVVILEQCINALAEDWKRTVKYGDDVRFYVDREADAVPKSGHLEIVK